jgi:D-alanyl-D-alanine carboxypeptidase/D-alanyl-D-alanine-endopeptidase (penicillin-binding protein 4)
MLFGALCLASLGVHTWAGAQTTTQAAPRTPTETTTSAPRQGHTAWPNEVAQALERLKIPADALSVVILDPQRPEPALWQHRPEVSVNPASLMKLVTTTAALDLLGPAFTWNTPVYADGPIKDGVLQGNVYLRGQGDPRLVVERLWLLLRRLQAQGVARIQGDIVLDRSAFVLAPRDPASFDGEPLRPYNAAPDALLINFKSIVLGFVPDAAAKLAHVQLDPPMAGVSHTTSVPLVGGPCTDYRASLRADFQDPERIRLLGNYPASCGERAWPLAYADPASHSRRAVAAMWQLVAGPQGLSGTVREGTVPPDLRPLFQFESAPLGELIRDINKFSNNVMAQQLFLTLGLQQRGVGSFEASREVVRWWRERLGEPLPVLDNGSGLSREERSSAQGLARLLLWVHRSPFQAELVASLPLSGQDGTLRRSRAQASAHLKTGSLRDVSGVAGFVHSPGGKTLVLVALVNSPQVSGANARALFDVLVDWSAKQADRPSRP